jgi:uncharacterized membrane protein YpjA
MEPIINPMWFYYADVINSFKNIFLIIGLICIVGLIFKQGKKLLCICGIVLIIVGGFMPAETTMYKMYAASLVTPNNIEQVENYTKDNIDYIITKTGEIIKPTDLQGAMEECGRNIIHYGIDEVNNFIDKYID